MAFNFDSYVASRLRLIETALAKVTPRQSPRRLARAMNYSLLAGGKRLRPLLVLASAEACGLPAHAALPTACAFECLHTYSLIHDDLPAMDDDDIRRGRPTSHKAFDEATAILAGDALLTLAFELVAANGKLARVGPTRAADAVAVLAKAAGAQGMVGGQMHDILAEGKRINAKQLKVIHAGKTGALIRGALEAGAALAGAKPAQRQALLAFGRHIGLAFQICDDILNVVGDARKLGKKTGSDQARKKATYPSLFGLEKARTLAKSEWKAAQKRLKIMGAKAEPLAALARFVIERDR